MASKAQETQASKQPVGAAVTLSQPASRPSRVTIRGKVVTITPLTTDHASDLYDIVQGQENEHLFTYLFDSPYPSLSAFEDAFNTKSKSEDPLFFAIVDNVSSKIVGWASLMRIDPVHRVVEIGNILFSPLLQRTKAGTETMYLLAKYVFEDLKYRRFEWKCDNLNAPSKRAAIRFGFRFEGIFWKHMVYKARNRDTCWFAMTEEDWKTERGVRYAFEEWLSEDNFDAEGKQRKRLEEFRDGLKGLRGPVVLET